MRISETKSKVIAFCGHGPVRTKIVVNGTCAKQVNHFNYPVSDINCD